MNTINVDVCGNINEYDNFKCEYLEIKESDYDQYSGHSSYVSYCNLIKEEVPICGWRRYYNKEKKCELYGSEIK